MTKFTLPRWPYSQERFFSALALIVFFVPLVFSLKTHENFETVKLCLFFILLAWASFEFFKKNGRRRQALIELSKAGEEEKGTGLSRSFLFFLGTSVILAAVSAVFSPNFNFSFFGLYSRYTGGLLFYLAWVLFVFFLGCVKGEEKLEFLAKILVLDSLLIAAYGLLQSVGIGFYNGPDTASIIRSPSFAGNPNFSAMFLVAVLPINFALLFKSHQSAVRIYYALCGFFSLWALIFFSSRGALLALVVSVAFLCIIALLNRPSRRFGLAVLLFGLVGAGLFSIFIGLIRPQLLTDTLKLNDTNTSLRLYVWDIASRAIISHPVLGVGLGNFLDYYEISAGKSLADQSQAFDDPHNLFLYQASAGGLPFAMVFLILLVISVTVSVKSFIKSGNFLFLGLAAGLLAWFTSAFFNPVSVTNYIVLGPLLAGAYIMNGNERLVKIGLSAKIFLAFFSVGLLIFGMSLITAEHLFYQGYNAYFSRDFSRASKYFKLASEIFPFNPTYKLYALGAKIKVEKDSPEVLRALEAYNRPGTLIEALKAANLNFLLYMETHNILFGHAAVNSLQRAMAMNPNFADPYIRAGFFSQDMGLSAQAMIFLNNGLTLNPQAFPGWMLKAKIHQSEDARKSMVFALKQVAKVYTEDNQLKKMIYVAERADNIKAIPIQIGANYDKLE